MAGLLHFPSRSLASAAKGPPGMCADPSKTRVSTIAVGGRDRSRARPIVQIPRQIWSPSYNLKPGNSSPRNRCGFRYHDNRQIRDPAPLRYAERLLVGRPKELCL